LVACLEDASGEGLDKAKEHVRRRADKANRIGDPRAAGDNPAQASPRIPAVNSCAAWNLLFFEHLIDVRLRAETWVWRRALSATHLRRTWQDARLRQRRQQSPISPHSTDQMEAIMAKEPKNLDDLFHDTLKDIYFAEKKILSTLPKMAKAAQSPDLKEALEKHRGETEGHVARLEKIFAAIDKKPQAKTCDAIVGITDEGAEIMKEYKGSPALDAGLLAAAQAVEHYEISRYGTMKTWAQELGLKEAVRLLDQTLAEEKKTDATLTEIAEAVVNQQAEAA
jgi:ferritin-like metal-binding protein YciE